MLTPLKEVILRADPPIKQRWLAEKIATVETDDGQTYSTDETSLSFYVTGSRKPPIEVARKIVDVINEGWNLGLTVEGLWPGLEGDA